MGFLSEYGTARETARTLDDQALARQRQVIADQTAAQARMEKMKQAEILRRMPKNEELSTPDKIGYGAVGAGGGGTWGDEGRRDSAPAAAPAPATRTENQTDAESQRLARQAPPSSADEYTQAIARMKASRAAGKPFDQQDVALTSRGPAGGPTTAGENPATMYGSRYEELQRLNTMASAQAQQKGAAPSAAPAPTSGADFISRIRQAESGGNMAAVGPNIPGQGTAKSDMQVMDKTSGDPGYGVRPAQNSSLEERARVGRDYAVAMLARYGNEPEAAAAYNWGPGNYDRWKAAGANPAQMPAETRNYVAKVTGQPVGGAAQQAQAPAQAQAPMPMGAQPETPIARVIASGGFTPEQLSHMAGQQSRMAQFRMQQAEQLAQVTSGPAELAKLQEAYATAQNAYREAHFANMYAEGRMSPEQYAQVSAQERERASAEAAERQKVMLKAQGEAYTAEAKGIEDRRTEAFKAIAAAGGKPEAAKIEFSPDQRTTFVTYGQRVYQLVPAVSSKFGPGEARLVPINMPG